MIENLRAIYKSKDERFAYTLILSLAFMTFVPSFEIGTLIFLASFILISIKSIRIFKNDDLLKKENKYVFILFFILLIFFTQGLISHYPLFDVIKSALPFFLFVWCVYFATPLIRSRDRFIATLFLSGSIWAIRLIGHGSYEFMFGTDLKWLRLTLVNADAVIPFPLIIIPILLFDKTFSLRRSLRITVFILQIIIVIWAGYRSQQILVLLMIGIWILRYIIKDLKKIIFLFFMIFGLIEFFNATDFASDNPMISYQLGRFSNVDDETHESGRALERKFAFQTFYNNYFLGSGFGTPIPAEITYASTDVAEDYVIPKTVVYMHNAYFYILMVGGIPFLLSYLMIWINFIKRNLDISSIVLAFGLLAFITVEATFLQIHFNILLAFLYKLSKNKNKEKI